ncbi:hypothetical protein CQA78_30710, partial [Klebsiella pneumoniae]
ALARFFPAAFTFARRMYDALPVMFDHQWCGVTQLGWDEKSAHKIAQMLALARFFPAAFTFARRMYDALPVMFDHQWCGVT